MKALIFKDIGNIKLEEITDPKIENNHEVIVKISITSICGTDLHLVRGTMPGVKKGTILGHEAVGIIEKIGSEVKKLKVGDRVIIPSTIGCGDCKYCKIDNYSQCNNANPNGPNSGTVFFGGPKRSGSLDGMQAEKVKVPYADSNLIIIPEDIAFEKVILLSDILPTAYMAVENAKVKPNDKIAVFGCGPVGQLVIFCLKKMGIKDIFAIDNIQSRLEMCASQGAIPINFDNVGPVEKIKELTDQQGADKVIDAVGIDANQPKQGILSYFSNQKLKKQFKREVKDVAPKTNPKNGNWIPGNGPSQVLQWAADCIAKNGIISLIGVYTKDLRFFPIGKIFGKNIEITMGNCNHHKYIPKLLEWVKNNEFDSSNFVTHKLMFDDIITAYEKFDKREDNWIKVILFT